VRMDEHSKVRKGKYVCDCASCGLLLADFDKQLAHGIQCPRCLKQTEAADHPNVKAS